MKGPEEMMFEARQRDSWKCIVSFVEDVTEAEGEVAMKKTKKKNDSLRRKVRNLRIKNQKKHEKFSTSAFGTPTKTLKKYFKNKFQRNVDFFTEENFFQFFELFVKFN